VEEFLYGEGFRLSSNPAMCKTQAVYCSHIANCAVLVQADGGRRVTISESNTSSIFPPILATLDTSLMLIVRPEGMIILYPRQTLSSIRICHRSRVTQERIHISEWLGLHNNFSSNDWKGPCGNCCPMFVRRLCGLRGSAYLDWESCSESGGRAGMLEFVKEEHFKWKLGTICLNECCPFYEYREIR
jgi:hypothetical protein